MDGNIHRRTNDAKTLKCKKAELSAAFFVAPIFHSITKAGMTPAFALGPHDYSLLRKATLSPLHALHWSVDIEPAQPF